MLQARIADENPYDAPKKKIGSIELECLSPKDAVSRILSLVINSSGVAVHLVNAYTIALADKDPKYRELFRPPAINLPDGKPITWVSALRKDRPKLKQVRGPQLFLDIFDQGRQQQVRHYLLGSTPEILSKLRSNLDNMFPGIDIAGDDSPPFREMTKAEILIQDARIRESNAQVIWVGLGTPKQDFEVNRIANSLPVVAIAVGAAFNFTAGTAKQSPKWLRQVGLEWFFRLVSEPRRLWRRYLFGNLRFLRAIFFPAGTQSNPNENLVSKK